LHVGADGGNGVGGGQHPGSGKAALIGPG
jgi:hypothetical protein